MGPCTGESRLTTGEAEETLPAMPDAGITSAPGIEDGGPLTGWTLSGGPSDTVGCAAGGMPTGGITGGNRYGAPFVSGCDTAVGWDGRLEAECRSLAHCGCSKRLTTGPIDAEKYSLLTQFRRLSGIRPENSRFEYKVVRMHDTSV